ncbi:hypothetical protein LSH36_1612g00000 [Paralvinella palmiformis]|uniref:P-type domain-containing protein n=1 Tax=Paralvinella palmiformis TaxID=53620 RepID=A0AAD9ISG0_9ANNE|nr:hypothetical protein LSH36_1612g00000 [Paralvinella palmiformis]
MAETGMKKSTIIMCSVAIGSLSLGAIVGLVLHYTVRDEPLEPGPRYDVVGNCIPQGDISKANCDNRGCTWREPTDGAPWCTFPPGYGYIMDGPIEETSLGYRVKLAKSPTGAPLYSDDLMKLTFEAEFHSDYRIRLKFSDPERSRYQIPTEAINIESPDRIADNETRLYDVIFQNEQQFGLMVIRRSSGEAVFNITVNGLVFSDKYIQITNRLASSHLYGLGEHNHQQYKHSMNWKNWTIFTRDEAPVDHWNLYGAQPFYMNLEEDGNSNGVLLLNSNAMDIVLQPDPHPAITYHVIGGILDFYVFLGPTPENIVQQYTEAVGRPFMPPYWALGFQLSRWGYANLTQMETVVNRNRDAGIPQDVQYGDIDYMQSKLDFTYDKQKFAGLPKFVDELHDNGQRFIIILDHCIGSNETLFNLTLNGDYPPYYDGIKEDVFIRDPRNGGDYLKGQTGADICGFWFAASEEMCIRWMQLGAFYPFSRNHNGEGWPDQDPAAFGQPMTRISRDILMTRYRLLPYLYTLLHEAHTDGSTVVRPLMNEVPQWLNAIFRKLDGTNFMEYVFE